MAVVGYKRVSSEQQNLDRQDFPCDKVFVEKVSGASSERKALQEMIEWVRDGDEVKVHSIDRLARNLRDLQNLIQTLNDKGVSVSFISEGLTFSGKADDAFSKLQLQMMGAFAEFERNISRKRQMEGIAKAKDRGAYKGRKKSIDDAKIKEMKSSGMRPSEIARLLGISRMSVYRILSAI